MGRNITIDEQLMAEALNVTGAKTEREVVEMGLKTLIRLQKQGRIKTFRGKLEWDGDLDEMRRTG